MEQLADLIGRNNMGNAIVMIILMAIIFTYIFFCKIYLRNKPMKLTFGGTGFCGLLFVILLLLKAGVVETAAMGWSWWWIASPLWGPVTLIVCIPLLLIIMAILFVLVTGIIWCIIWCVTSIKYKCTKRKKSTCLRKW